MFQVVGIGEVLWDMLPDGPQLGGAPANFTYHARALGANGRLISRVGKDAAGSNAIERLQAIGIPTDCLEIDPLLPTGTVTVELSNDGQAAYAIRENVAWDALTGECGARAIVSAADAICFGTLAQRSEQSRRTIRSLVAATPSNALRILDVNLRQPFFSADIIKDSLALANVLKLNEAELPLLGKIFRLAGPEREQIETVAAHFQLRCVAYTRGAHGSLLFADGEWSERAGAVTAVADTIGAGDSFTAAMTLGLLEQWPLDEIHSRASDVAAFVCTRHGATPELPNSLRELFQTKPTNSLIE